MVIARGEGGRQERIKEEGGIHGDGERLDLGW